MVTCWNPLSLSPQVTEPQFPSGCEHAGSKTVRSQCPSLRQSSGPWDVSRNTLWDCWEGSLKRVLCSSSWPPSYWPKYKQEDRCPSSRLRLWSCETERETESMWTFSTAATESTCRLLTATQSLRGQTTAVRPSTAKPAAETTTGCLLRTVLPPWKVSKGSHSKCALTGALADGSLMEARGVGRRGCPLFFSFFQMKGAVGGAMLWPSNQFS